MSKKIKLGEIKIQSFVTNLEPQKLRHLKGGDCGCGCGAGCECTCAALCTEETCETCIGTPCRDPNYTWYTSPCKCTNNPENCPW